MFRLSPLGLACVAAITSAVPRPAFAQPNMQSEKLLITGGRILNPDGNGWLEGHALLVANGRIADVGPADAVDLSPELPHLDLNGAYLVPGLIDLHTHLLLHPYDEASWEHQVLKESLGLRTARGVAAARATLEAGFTTIRELGTEGAGFADVGLRDAVSQGIVPGPRILTATRALVASGAYGPSGFDPRWEIPKGAQVADGPDGVRVAVRQQIAAGADWIKIYADYRRKSGDPSTPTYSLAELEAAVDEATSAGLPVSAHASTDEAIRRSVEAGVKSIEHGTGASAETLALMRERGVALCPTLAASEAIDRYAGRTPGGPMLTRLQESLEMFRRALESGVTIACGSDAGVFAHGDNVRELELMVQGGMSPADALRAATSVAAGVIGRGDDLGRIGPGHSADLVAVAQDPLADIAALRRPLVIVQSGRIVLDRRAVPSSETRTRLLAMCKETFAALGEGRFDDLAAMFTPEATVSFDLAAAGQQASMSAQQFMERAGSRYGPESDFHEWLSGEPRVLVDDGVAVIWAPFLVESGGRRASGVDVFGFLKLDGQWKISWLAFTNRPL